MELYLDRMCGGYSWSRYLRMLERMLPKPDIAMEHRAPTVRIARFLHKSWLPGLGGRTSNAAELALSMRVSKVAAPSRFASAASAASMHRADTTMSSIEEIDDE